MSDVNTPLWTPSEERKAGSVMREFADFCEERHRLKFDDYETLHGWSVDESTEFWSALWDFAPVVGDKGTCGIVNETAMPGAQFFPDARMSFAQNMLAKTGSEPAIFFRGEDKAKFQLSWDELHAMVSKLQQAFVDAGVKKGDRIAAMMPNMPQTIACMLAANSLGAIWSSCSPDFGEQGVLDRFLQIEPILFVACDGYWYNGKKIDVSVKLQKVAPEIGAVATIIVPYLGTAEEVATSIENAVVLDALLEPYAAKPVEFELLPFNHPLYILFSSGTTGIPKCIVHSQGGVLMQHLKEHLLHCNVREGERVFYFTTCGWMMWNWLVSSLACKATLMLYDGSPFYPDGNVIFDYAQEEKFNFFGTSAKFIDAVRNEGRRPIETHDLSSVHTIASTGSPLSPENFDFVYDGIMKDVHLASVSGGTDIVACFVCAVPWKPVYSGEIQGPALGMGHLSRQ